MTLPGLASPRALPVLLLISTSTATYSFRPPPPASLRPRLAPTAPTAEAARIAPADPARLAARTSPAEGESAAAASTVAAVESPSAVERVFEVWNRRDFDAAASLFAERVSYEDATFDEPYVSRGELRESFARGAALLPPTTEVVLDGLAVDGPRGKVGARWHLEVGGLSLPFSRGCSFYTADAETGLITTGFKCTESPVKPDEPGMAALSLASGLVGGGSPPRSATSGILPEGASLVETYFDAWNRRDMDAALACFSDGCAYEDTVFLRPFAGRDALRAHLEKNARAMPSGRIVLDDIAVDGGRGVIGATWHLEIGDRGLFIGRGCSMYELDRGSGLIRSGFDVSESMVKIPRASLDLASLPLRMLQGVF